MKKQNLLVLFSGLSLFIYSPFVVFADSDGSLQLNSNMITNQSGETVNTSDYAIRAQLFSKVLDKQIEEKKEKEEAVINQVEGVNFKEKHLSKLYQKNYRPLQKKLFKNYGSMQLASADVKPTSYKKGSFLLLLIFSIPLLLVTSITAKNLTRRKRRIL